MSGRRLVVLKKHERGVQHTYFHHWMLEAATLQERWEMDEDDPFAYNEAASVSVLVAAAARAGYIGIADYVCDKRARGDEAEYRRGRADLYLATHNISWAFEFKQKFRGTYNDADTAMASALNDARDIDGEAKFIYGGVIVSVAEYDGNQRINYVQDLKTFGKSCTFAYGVGDEHGELDTFFLFKQYDRRRAD